MIPVSAGSLPVFAEAAALAGGGAPPLVYLPLPGYPDHYLPMRLPPPAPPPGALPARLDAELALDLRAATPRQVARAFDDLDAWPDRARAVTRVDLPDLHAARSSGWMIQRVASLPSLRQLLLRAPAARTRIDLRALRQAPGQVDVLIDLSQAGGCLVQAQPGTPLYARTTEHRPARSKHWLQVSTPSQPAACKRTLPGIPYLRVAALQDDPRTGAELPASRLAMARLLRQWLLDAKAALLDGTPADPPPAAAGPEAGRAGSLWTADGPMRLAAGQISEALATLSQPRARLEYLLAGLAAAHQAQAQRGDGAQPLPHHRFDYTYACTPGARKRYVGPVCDLAVDALLTQPPWTTLLPEALGSALAALWPHLREGEARHLLLVGQHHTLALVLRRRAGETASVVCYDPHMPANHVRTETPTRDALAQLGLRQLLVEPRALGDYLGTRPARQVAVYDLLQLLLLPEGLHTPGQQGAHGVHRGQGAAVDPGLAKRVEGKQPG